MVLSTVFKILMAVVAVAAKAQFLSQPQFYYQQPQMPMQQGMPGGLAPAIPPPMPPGMPAPMLPAIPPGVPPPMPPGVPHEMPPGIPQQIMAQYPQMPGMFPQMHMLPLQLPMSGGKLPMMVMPKPKKNRDKKKYKKSSKLRYKRLKQDSFSSKYSGSPESELYLRSRNNLKPKKGKRRRKLPAYVTKNEYSWHHKKVKKDKLNDWLKRSSSEDYSRRGIR